MKLEFKDIINKHKGKKCIVVGHGPSLNPYLDKLKDYKNNGYIIIGCNNWNEFYINTPPHYWLNANNADDTKTFLNVINTHKPIWIYADSVDLADKKWIEENINVDYLPYDQRHFEGKRCSSCDSYGCDKYLNPNRLTIQEELKKYTNFKKRYNSGHTVAVHMLAFSILLGCSEIYVIGLDFDYHIGYAKNTTNRAIPENAYWHFDLDRYGSEILEDVKTIYKSAQKVGVKMYNSNPNSSWKIMEYKGLPILNNKK